MQKRQDKWKRIEARIMKVSLVKTTTKDEKVSGLLSSEDKQQIDETIENT